jgi:hypothetical protein
MAKSETKTVMKAITDIIEYAMTGLLIGKFAKFAAPLVKGLGKKAIDIGGSTIMQQPKYIKTASDILSKIGDTGKIGAGIFGGVATGISNIYDKVNPVQTQANIQNESKEPQQVEITLNNKSGIQLNIEKTETSQRSNIDIKKFDYLNR